MEKGRQRSPLDNIGIILDRTRHAANIGAVCRVMKNLGFGKLHLVSPTQYGHLSAVKMTQGAEDLLESALVENSLEDAAYSYHSVIATSRRMKQDSAYDISEGARKIAELSINNKVAVLFGSEKFGLKRADLDRCDGVISLPVDPGFASVNLAQAVTMVCLEIKLQSAKLIGADPEKFLPKIELPVGERERFHSEFYSLFSDLGLSAPSIYDKIKALFDRANMTETEQKLFYGLIKEIRKRTGTADEK